MVSRDAVSCVQGTDQVRYEALDFFVSAEVAYAVQQLKTDAKGKNIYIVVI